MNRRQFFLEAYQRLLKKHLLKKQRPPGASPTEKEFRTRCVGCDACMIACPVNIVMIEDLRTRLPLIYPEKGPCLHCTGYPCIAACPTGALSPSNSPETRLF
jgi:ferredoxin